MRHARALWLAAFFVWNPPLRADTIVGAHLTLDRISDVSIVGGELFARYFVEPSLALEAAAGYRRHVVTNFHGPYNYTTATDQFPVLLGVTYFFFSPGQTLTPWLGGGFVVAPESTRVTYSTGGSYSISTVGFGFQVGAGLQLKVDRNGVLDAGVRYVPALVSAESRGSLRGSFVRFQAGFAYRF